MYSISNSLSSLLEGLSLPLCLTISIPGFVLSLLPNFFPLSLLSPANLLLSPNITFPSFFPISLPHPLPLILSFSYFLIFFLYVALVLTHPFLLIYLSFSLTSLSFPTVSPPSSCLFLSISHPHSPLIFLSITLSCSFCFSLSLSLSLSHFSPSRSPLCEFVFR